jgi:DNA-directed RNA polymerase subunit RPC12/RpoP
VDCSAEGYLTVRSLELCILLHRAPAADLPQGLPRFPESLSWDSSITADGAMTEKGPDNGPAPICSKCGARMSHYATLPKTHERPMLVIYRCDRCLTTVSTLTETPRT